MGGGQSSDRRSAYTYSQMEETGWNWGQAKKDYHIALKDGGNYTSDPSDLLQYRGCVSFAATPDTTPMQRAPCYSVEFNVMDRQLRASVAAKVVEVWRHLGFMEGPVAVFIYRDMNALGDGNEWFWHNGQKNNYNFDRFQKEWSQTYPITVQLLFPSIMRSGVRAPNYATLGSQHRWLSDILEMPQTSFYNKYMMQCYTYCEDDAGKFFPCGCSWKNECQAKVVGAEGIIATTSKHTLFYGAYAMWLDHPALQGAFAQATWRTLKQNILSMDIDMYNNCRFALKSDNEEFYIMQMTYFRMEVLRKGPVGKKRVCKESGWWIFKTTYCYDEPYPTQRYGEVCKTYEGQKYGFNECSDDNNMCADKSRDANNAFSDAVRNQQGYHGYYALPFMRPAWRVKLSLTADALVAYAEDREQAGEVVWYWSLGSVPVERRIPPLALVLTDKGELVLFNGRNEKVTSLSKDFGVDVHEDDDGGGGGGGGDGDDGEDAERKRQEEVLNDLRNRAAKAREDDAARKAFQLGKESGGDGSAAGSAADDDGLFMQCPPPPLDFI